ncbi:MAG: glycosyltransferase [Rhodospirillum sp.]|nr:glycosyltransferase [Rhodospirillum sp.]MCF8487619.1 glycosyltransferase [Rhodospirillum sp.]MCF8499223.1 glycosyltransferase [Rhodospirillum sp.]
MSIANYPSGKELAIIRSLPFDYKIILDNIQTQGLSDRLETERSLVEDGRLVMGDGRPIRVGALVVGADPLTPHARELLYSLVVQSFLPTSVALLPAVGVDPDHLEIWAMTMGSLPTCVVSDVRAWMAAETLDLVVVLGEGTVAHPGLFMGVARAARRDQPDFMVWNHVLIAPSGDIDGVTYLRCPDPRTQPHALDHMDICGPSWAISPALLSSIEGPLETRLVEGWRHPLTIELFRRDFKTTRLTEFLGAHHRDTFHIDAWPLARDALADYRRLLETEGFLLVVDPENALQPIRRSPLRRALTIDAIISFRNKADLTIKALRSLERQETTARLCVFLVDNQSDPEERRLVEDAARTTRDGVVARVLSYDRPFNHSAQTNLATAVGQGEVLLFMSNDCVLGPATLDEMAAWALVPDIGSVGPRIETAEGKLSCSGISALYLNQNFLPLVVEGFDHHLAGSIREVVANTFACACVSRAVFQHAGPLNDVDFPIGLNDVEYGLRLERLGYRNLYLGPILAEHEALGSRVGADDGAQADLLRVAYPSLFTDKERRFEFDFLRQAKAVVLRSELHRKLSEIEEAGDYRRSFKEL